MYLELKTLLEKQRSFNEEIRKTSNLSKEEWTQTYLLGMISEMDEVLDEINWKKHRKVESSTDFSNLGYELADLTKYVLSLWELWGFNSMQIYEFVMSKSEMLEELKRQDFEEIPSDRLVIICDIDGTLGDWRSSFIEWLMIKGFVIPFSDLSNSLMIDHDLSMKYQDYYELKEEYESSGEYRNIQPYEDTVEFLKYAREKYNAYIIIVTSRPQDRYSRIWIDTMLWLNDHFIPVDKLKIGAEFRILLAVLISKTTRIIMLEDDPGFIVRGANSEIKILARKHPYNSGISHKNIAHVDKYTAQQLDNFMKGE